MFQANEEQSEKLEIQLREKIQKESQSQTVARAVAIVLPLLLEHQAITKYINLTRNYQLRNQMPEILTVEEAVYLVMKEIPSITKNELKQTMNILMQYQKDLPKGN